MIKYNLAAKRFSDLPEIESEYYDALSKLDHKIIVLDDDPTGVQCVHGVNVYTDYSYDSIKAGFEDEHRVFFILTNSRAFSSSKTKEVHEEIARNIVKAAKETNRKFIIISRGDSTLRGHYPLETETLRKTIEKISNFKIDGEIICPFFKEGGRFTIDNVHYVLQNDELIPAGETEFARDKTFGYTSSNLIDWIFEKTSGKCGNSLSISIDELRNKEFEGIRKKLKSLIDFQKIIVNAFDEIDLKLFLIALAPLLDQKNFIMRTAAPMTKIMGGISSKPLLTKSEVVNNGAGGIIVIGSHVKKTTEQFEELKKVQGLKFIEINQHQAVDLNLYAKEIKRVRLAVEQSIKNGETAVIYTRRERLDLNNGDKEAELTLAKTISDGITSIVANLGIMPRFIIAKGGITSSDIGVNGLGVKKALVLGQIQPGIPVWKTGEESKFPGMAYIIFPGNVGNKDTLKSITESLL